MFDGYELVIMTKDNLARATEDWTKDIQGNTSDDLIGIAESSYDRRLMWMAKGVEEKNPTEHGFFVLLDTHGNQTPAILEMTDARKGKDSAFKLLNIYFSPNLNLEFKENCTQDDRRSISKVLGIAIARAFGHALNSNSKLKMYNRTQEIAQIFETMLALNAMPESPYLVYRQSMWLIFELKKST